MVYAWDFGGLSNQNSFIAMTAPVVSRKEKRPVCVTLPHFQLLGAPKLINMASPLQTGQSLETHEDNDIGHFKCDHLAIL